MAAIVTLIVTFAFSMLITRIASVALTLTGLSQEVARFQARSAFSGVGFTTSESESVINHPVRRKIIGSLMLWGNLGIAAMVASTISSFATMPATSSALISRLFVLTGGLSFVWVLGSSRIIDRGLSRIIEWSLLRWTKLDVRDYVSLLHLSEGYVVLELQLKRGDWVVDKSLMDSRLSLEGVLVLGIQRANGVYIGSPNGTTYLRKGDVLSIYGPIERLEELDLRRNDSSGDRAHRIAVAVHYEQMTETLRLDGNGLHDRPTKNRDNRSQDNSDFREAS